MSWKQRYILFLHKGFIMSDYIEERIRQLRYQVAHRLIEHKKYSFEEIADIVDISLEDVTELSEHPEYFDD